MKKTLQLSKNKLLRLFINVVFIIGWIILLNSNLINRWYSLERWELKDLHWQLYLYSYHWFDGGIWPRIKELLFGFDLGFYIEEFLKFLTYKLILIPTGIPKDQIKFIPIIFITACIWFKEIKREFFTLLNKLKNYVLRIFIKNSNADEIRKYADLKEKGLITEEEFQAKKKKLLDL